MPRKSPHLAAAERSLRDLLAALAAVEAAGAEPVRLGHAAGGWFVLLQVGPARRAWELKQAERRLPRQPPPARSRCRDDCLAAVRGAGRTLTRGEVVMATQRAGKRYSASTVGKALAELTACGGLVNPGDGRGYRLPEWVTPPGQPALFE